MQTLLTSPAPGSSPVAFDEGLRIAGPVSEDCLYLNIWTAAKAAGEQRPVIVWIPGGGFTRGAATLPSTDGAALAAKGAVIVSMNYRLGLFGFLSHPELTRESAHSSSGNYGFLDQIAALRWVQKNIAAFGGDPSNITIFGQSAGSISASVLMASPLARGLFHRVIGTSGAAVLDGPIPMAPPALPRGETQEMADRRGASFAESVGAASIEELRMRPADELLRATTGDALSIAHVDGWFLPDQVVALFRLGRQNDVPLLIGWNENESTPVAPRTFSVGALQEHISTHYPTQSELLRRLYPAASDQDARNAYARYLSDLLVGVPMRNWAQLQATTGTNPVYVFFFERAAPDTGEIGAGHGAEVVYAFNNVRQSQRPFAETDRALSDRLSTYFLEFARTGDPNSEALPTWPAYDERGETVLAFGDAIQARAMPQKSSLEFLGAFFSESNRSE